MDKNSLIPFFVVDRPISLDILICLFSKYPNKKWGILTHAFTTKKFKKKFKNFPINSKCPLNEKKKLSILRKNIIKIVDSGIFSQNRQISYEKLFEIYENLDADYGVIIDYLKDTKKTLESAKKALEIYKQKKYSFKLIGVIQGNTIDEYLECYKELKNMGYKYIAIGGLLKRKGNSSIVVLSCEKFLKELLEKIKKEFNPSWLFVFGIFHKNRISLLNKFNVWGADYKGWLFQYDTNYSNLLDYLKGINLDKKDKNCINNLLENIKKASNRKEKNLFKKKVNEILKKYNCSLQKVRIEQIISNLENHLVKNNLR